MINEVFTDAKDKMSKVMSHYNNEIDVQNCLSVLRSL